MDPVALYRKSVGSAPTRASQLISFSKSCTDLQPLSIIAAQQLIDSHNQSSGVLRWPCVFPEIQTTTPQRSETPPNTMARMTQEEDVEQQQQQETEPKRLSISPPESMSSPTPFAGPTMSPDSCLTPQPQMTPTQERVQRRMNKYARHIQEYSGSIDALRLDLKLEDHHDADSDSEDTKKRKRLRKRVVDELASTEKTYLHNLERLFSFFINPLMNGKEKEIKKLNLSMKDHNKIFPPDLRTIRGLHIQLNTDLIKATEDWNNETSKIGCIFIRYGDLFKMYQDYFHKHEQAVQHLIKLERKNPKFTKWTKETATKVNGLTIQALLILPIQRLPRYEMLLKQMIKRTDQYHCDMYDLKEALEQICEVTESINEKMKEHDRRLKVAMVEKRFTDLVDSIGHFVKPSRIFIAESSEDPSSDNYIVRHDKFGNRQPITLYLFSDCLIYGYYDGARPKSPGSEKRGKLRFGGILIFDQLWKIVDVPYDNNFNYSKISCFKILSRHHSLWISFPSFQSKVKWVELINDQYELLLDQDLDRRRRSSGKTGTKKGNGAPSKEPELYLPVPAFVPDDYSDYCMGCKSAFTILNRRHHCYYCGLLLCDGCSSKRVVDQWKQFFDGVEVNVRVCDQCHEDREQYLKEKENEYLYYRNEQRQQTMNMNINVNVNGNHNAKTAHSESKHLGVNDMETVIEEDVTSVSPSQGTLISPSTIDITKTFISNGSSRRLNKRRANMSRIHSKSNES